MTDNIAGNNTSDSDKKNRRLTEEEWAEIIKQYEYGAMGIVELSDKFGVSRQAISNRFKANGVVKGSKIAELQKLKEQEEARARAAAERYSTKRAEYIEETRMQGYAALKQAAALINRRILDVYKTAPGVTPVPATAMDDLKALRMFQSSLIENFDFRLNRLLNADDLINEDDLPSLVIEDMTVDDVIEHFREKGLVDDEADLDELREQVEQTQSEVRRLA